MSDPKIPKELDAIVDVVLAHRPRPKSKAAKQRKRLEKKLSRIAPQVDRGKNEHEH
jgi:hypothetical protein